MTAKDAYDIALMLIDNMESETENEDYLKRAPAVIDVLHRELAFYEGVAVSGCIDSLDDALEISDDTGSRILPYGIAASFALADKNGDMYNDFSYMYRALCRTIRHGEADAADEYGVLDGMA
jgi:hypothetical protein